MENKGRKCTGANRAGMKRGSAETPGCRSVCSWLWQLVLRLGTGKAKPPTACLDSLCSAERTQMPIQLPKLSQGGVVPQGSSRALPAATQASPTLWPQALLTLAKGEASNTVISCLLGCVCSHSASWHTSANRRLPEEDLGSSGIPRPILCQRAPQGCAEAACGQSSAPWLRCHQSPQTMLAMVFLWQTPKLTQLPEGQMQSFKGLHSPTTS